MDHDGFLANQDKAEETYIEINILLVILGVSIHLRLCLSIKPVQISSYLTGRNDQLTSCSGAEKEKKKISNMFRKEPSKGLKG